MEDIYQATEDWIEHFSKYKDQMYMTISQDNVETLLRYLNAVEDTIVEYKRERGDFTL